MKSALPFLLIAAAAPLAGCGTAPDSTLNEQQAAAEQQRAPDAEKVLTQRWAQMFTDPKAVVAAANEFGYKIDGYRRAEKGFAAKGAVTLPEKPSPVTVDAAFDAAGPTADDVERITFRFAPHRQGKADRASNEINRYPARLVNGFLSRFEVGPGDELNSAINNRQPVSVDMHGVLARVEVQPTATGSDTKDVPITVTFTRIGASAPANQTQGK